MEIIKEATRCDVLDGHVLIYDKSEEALEILKDENTGIVLTDKKGYDRAIKDLNYRFRFSMTSLLEENIKNIIVFNGMFRDMTL